LDAVAEYLRAKRIFETAKAQLERFAETFTGLAFCLNQYPQELYSGIIAWSSENDEREDDPPTWKVPDAADLTLHVTRWEVSRVALRHAWDQLPEELRADLKRPPEIDLEDAI
jgi:hypothetical protein